MQTARVLIGNDTTLTDYCGNLIYENGVAKTLLVEGGYVSLSDNKYHFYLQDHQGNNRVVTDENGNVEEVNHYYPFGGTFANPTSVQPYKYNGKELNTRNNLNWYDYGARHYDAALGRWHVVDPMAEKYYAVSPYAYCLGNPVNHIDPDGRSVIIWYKGNNGKMLSYAYNSGGNVAHSNSFVQSVITAYQYNKANGIKAGNGGGASTIALVEDKGIKVNVMEALDRNYYNSRFSTIYWRPDLGGLSNGIVRSPATAFDHEAAHALGHKTNLQEHAEKSRKNSDLQYETMEERRVITGPEQKTAFANGEIKKGEFTRKNHGGKSVITEGPTSNKIDKQKTLEYEKNKKVWTSEP